MKLFSTRQIAEIDRFTIENEPISDIDLMERAAGKITGWITKKYLPDRKFIIFAGPGNNGGDALAVARQLAELNYRCEVYLDDFGKAPSGSSIENLKRLQDQDKVKIVRITAAENFPEIHASDIILDGLFGSGLTRPLSGVAASIVAFINKQNNITIAIDIPSGLLGEDNGSNIPGNIIRADFTLTFQFPKIAFLFPENEKYVGQWEVLPIGLHPKGIDKVSSPFHLTDVETVNGLSPRRRRFAHKGDFGHALLIAGSYGKMGAAVLASKGCLRAGCGLLTTHVPREGYCIIQTAVPECMVSIDGDSKIFTDLPELKGYSAIGTGPGLGKSESTAGAFLDLLNKAEVPLVIDADALNILADHEDWVRLLPARSILTPHPGEFRRLVGETSCSYSRLMKQISFSTEFDVIIVLKGAFTSISMPDGRIYFNSTGNPGMATAGSGDALTGIILGLLAQEIDPENAALLGVYLHGLAGDIAAAEKSEPSLVAGDIIECLGKAFLRILT